MNGFPERSLEVRVSIEDPSTEKQHNNNSFHDQFSSKLKNVVSLSFISARANMKFANPRARGWFHCRRITKTTVTIKRHRFCCCCMSSISWKTGWFRTSSKSCSCQVTAMGRLLTSQLSGSRRPSDRYGWPASRTNSSTTAPLLRSRWVWAESAVDEELIH